MTRRRLALLALAGALSATVVATTMIPACSREGSGDDGAEFLYQGRLELEARGDSGWGGGAAFRLVHAVSSDADDNTQSAFDLFGSYTTPEALFARFGMLVAVDQPLGAGFDTGKVLTFHGALGTRF